MTSDDVLEIRRVMLEHDLKCEYQGFLHSITATTPTATADRAAMSMRFASGRASTTSHEHGVPLTISGRRARRVRCSWPDSAIPPAANHFGQNGWLSHIAPQIRTFGREHQH